MDSVRRIRKTRSVNSLSVKSFSPCFLMIARVLIFFVRLYQQYLSPLLGKNCRYEPTCSHYMIGSIQEWGVFKGVWLGLKRIGRCHPWGGYGWDPVPKKENKNK